MSLSKVRLHSRRRRIPCSRCRSSVPIRRRRSSPRHRPWPPSPRLFAPSAPRQRPPSVRRRANAHHRRAHPKPAQACVRVREKRRLGILGLRQSLSCCIVGDAWCRPPLGLACAQRPSRVCGNQTRGGRVRKDEATVPQNRLGGGRVEKNGPREARTTSGIHAASGQSRRRAEKKGQGTEDKRAIGRKTLARSAMPRAAEPWFSRASLVPTWWRCLGVPGRVPCAGIMLDPSRDHHQSSSDEPEKIQGWDTARRPQTAAHPARDVAPLLWCQAPSPHRAPCPGTDVGVR